LKIKIAPHLVLLSVVYTGNASIHHILQSVYRAVFTRCSDEVWLPTTKHASEFVVFFVFLIIMHESSIR